MAGVKSKLSGVKVLRFKQWLDEWNTYEFDSKAHRRKPGEYLYLFSMRAGDLRRLCDVYRRTRDEGKVEGIQRVREDSRTARIQRYVRFGYPYGDLKPEQHTAEFASLRKPGWLPTAIVVNILEKGAIRRGKAIKPNGVITIRETGEGNFELALPADDPIDASTLPPMEVIDGQHRLWAFDSLNAEAPVPDDFELPVVAYQGLDIAWQAYLFWSINVSPKRINPSHAFDLYPLLRNQDWLEQPGALRVYREARAQELTECLPACASCRRAAPTHTAR